MFKLDQLKETFAHAFKITDGKEDMAKEDYEILEKLSRFVVKRQMSVPAVMFLETMRPLNIIGSSTMSFFRPVIGTFFNSSEYKRLESILERRCSIGCLIETIEKIEDEMIEEKKQKKSDSNK